MKRELVKPYNLLHMTLKFMTLIAAVASVAVAEAGAAVKSRTLESPDGRLAVTVTIGDEITYSLSHDGILLVGESPVSISLADGDVLGHGRMPSKVIENSVRESFKAAIYKKNTVENNYNEIVFKYKEYSVIFRAYDDGMAYRFVIDSKNPFKVTSEQATFNFPDDWKAFIPYVRDYRTDNPDEVFNVQFYNSFENTYSHTAISEWEHNRLAFLPLLVEGDGGRKICITEADLLDYPGMYLYNGDASTSLHGVYAPCPDKIEQGGHNMLQGVVKTRKDYIASFDAGTVSLPWRIISVSEKDCQMADNDMVYRLASAPAEGSDFSWVKPGKVAWDWWNAWNLYGVDFRAGINNDTYKYYIDFASEHGIEYVILDEGWAVNMKADLMQIVPEIDLESLAEYAGERNVGLILWAGYWAFNRDMENVCRHYSEMGIKGFKVDFMDRDDQLMVDFHRRAAETAAKYKLMIDFHGTYKPAGLNRTYPNVVNFEGVHGLEQLKWGSESINQVAYDVTIPFIRMVAGPMDYTQGAMRNASYGNYRPVGSEAMSQGTRCRQLALYVVFESPLNMLCDSPSNYMAEKECTEFIAEIPTVWDETRALDGKVGEYVAMARRSGDTWYIGGITDWNTRDMVLDLSFIGDGRYVVDLFRDGVNADRAGRDYRKETVELPSDRQMKVHLAPGGGFAARIRPANL